MKKIKSVNIKETKDLPLEELYIGKNQQRKQVSEITLKELADNIASVGLIQPILVWPDGKGTYEILAGQRRYYAYKLFLKDKKTIRCQILDDSYTAIECKLFSWSENMEREDPSMQECIDMCTEVYKAYGSIEAVVSKTGIKKSHVEKYVKFERLPKELQEFVTNDDIHLDDALYSWDLVSDDDGDPQKAIQYAREFGQITSAKEKNAVKKVAKSNKVSPKKARPMAKKIEKHEIRLILLPNERDALNNYANTEGMPQEIAAYALVKNGLTKSGFLEDE